MSENPGLPAAFFSVAQAAQYACVCESVVRGWVRGGLAHYRLGLKRGKIAIHRDDLDAWIAGFKVAKKGPEPVKAPARSRPTLKHLRYPS